MYISFSQLLKYNHTSQTIVSKTQLYSLFWTFFFVPRTLSFKDPQYKVQHYGSNHPPLAGGDITQMQPTVAGVNVQPCIFIYPDHSGNSVTFQSEWELKWEWQRLFVFWLEDEAVSQPPATAGWLIGKGNSPRTGRIDQMPPTRLTSAICPRF